MATDWPDVAIRRRLITAAVGALLAAAFAGCARDINRGETVSGHRVALEVAPSPPAPGEVRLAASVTDGHGARVEGARVRFFYWMPYKGVPASPEQEMKAVDAKPADGRYAASVKLEKPGPWKIAVKVEQPGQEPDLATFTIDVRG